MQLLAKNPPWANLLRGEIELTKRVVNYSHELGALNGYVSASIGLAGNESYISDWVPLLGVEINTFERGSDKIFEGFVNKIDIVLGDFSLSIGPYLDITNRDRVDYQTQSYNTNPPIPGYAASTSWYSDSDSISLFGQRETIISGGTSNAVAAAEKAQTFLERFAWPALGQEVTPGSGAGTSLSLEVVGYHRIFDRYYYTYTAGVNNIALSVKLTRVVNGEPDTIFNTSDIETNSTITLNEYEEEPRIASDLINQIVEHGDSSNNRWIFGVLNDRKVYYREVPSSHDYVYRIRGKGEDVRHLAGHHVYHWDVKAGKWLMIPDAILGAPSRGLGQDYGSMFIESASYEAPWFATYGSGDATRIGQRLRRLGI